MRNLLMLWSCVARSGPATAVPSTSLWGAGRALVAVLLGAAFTLAWAQDAAVTPALAAQRAAERNLNDWLRRMQEATTRRSFTGTFVVSSNGGQMASSRIWHICDGEQQMERIDVLTGPPRTTLRHNNEVLTLAPDQKTARTESRDFGGLFPGWLPPGDASLNDLYAVRTLGLDRVAGYEADVIQLQPKDALRYGYRVWVERRTGLVLKLQTLQGDGRVLEQSAYSELQLDAPVRMAKLQQMMAQTEGYQMERSDKVKTTAAEQGWQLKSDVAGFKAVSCLKHGSAVAQRVRSLQWVFSDGLAAVSLFIEPYDPQRHLHEGRVAMGATHMLMRRQTDWWITAMGEVPEVTLDAFVGGLERRH